MTPSLGRICCLSSSILCSKTNLRIILNSVFVSDKYFVFNGLLCTYIQITIKSAHGKKQQLMLHLIRLIELLVV